MKKKFLFIFILMIILAGFFVYRVAIKNLWLYLTKPTLPEAVEYVEQRMTSELSASLGADAGQEMGNEAPIINNESQISPIILPSSFNLNVPFTAQAPLADWNETFKEACEEATSLIVHYYYQNKTFTPQIATEEILKMVDWQNKNFGGHFDLTAKETAQMIREYFGYKSVEIIDNPGIDLIKWHIVSGRPIIAPAAGQLLGNPYFRQPGPVYHMLVIKGYTKTQLITNDPGTKRGADFLYDYDVIMNALHDWNATDILKGEKRILVVYPD